MLARTSVGGLRQGRGLLLRGQDYSEKIMQRPNQTMNKGKINTVCLMCVLSARRL